MHDSAGAVIGGVGYPFGGGESASYATVQRISVATGAEVGSLPHARSDLLTASTGGAVYILGGYDGSARLPEVLKTVNGCRSDAYAYLRVTSQTGLGIDRPL